MSKSIEELWQQPTLSGLQASRASGIPYNQLRLGIQCGIFDFGVAWQTGEVNKRYTICTRKLKEYVEGVVNE